MQTWVCYACVVAIGISGGRAMADGVDTVGAHTPTPGRHGVIAINEDRFYNYDSHYEIHSHLQSDWPVGLVFRNNAYIDKVKTQVIGSPYTYNGSTKSFWLDDDVNVSGSEWDGDGGRKNIGGCVPESSTHIRLYAPFATDRMYNVTLGFYVLGTAHYDDYECDPAWVQTGQSTAGWSESAETEFAYHIQGKGYTVQHDCCLFHNQESWRQEGNHIWHNDGNATYVDVP